MRRCVLFDLDGTLIDSASLHTTAFSRAVERWWKPCEVPTRTDLTTQQKMDQIGVPNGLREQIQTETRAITMDLIPEMARSDDGLVSELDDLRLDHFFGVVTNARREPVEAMLTAMGIRGYMDILVTSEDGKHKPAPDLYRVARARAMQAGAGLVMAVEDSDTGVEAALRAGLRCLKVRGPQDITAKTIREFSGHR